MDTTEPTTSSPAHPSVIDEMIDRCQQMIQEYWQENPNLYRARATEEKTKIP